MPATDPASLLERWRRRVRQASFSHYAAAEKYSRYNRSLGIPVIALTTVVGTSVFASLQQTIDQRLQIAVGLISVIAAVLAGLQTFLGFSERAEKHRITAARYGAIRRKIEVILACPDQAQLRTPAKLEEIRVDIDKLAEDAPGISDSVWKNAQRTIAEADADSVDVVAKPG